MGCLRWIMNPLFAVGVGIINLLRRKCPKCGRELLVPLDKMNKAIPCRYCGSILQPQNRNSSLTAYRHKVALFHHAKKHEP